MPDNHRSDLGILISGLLQNKDLIKELEASTDHLLRKRTHYKFARHLKPSDLISSITLKLLDGVINWDPEVCTLDSFYYIRIRTEISNLIKKEKKFLPGPLENSEKESDYDGEVEENISSPEEFIIYPFEEIQDEEEYDPLVFTKIAYEILQDSPEEYLVFDSIYKGLQTKDISRDLGLTKDEVHNIKRRIKRIMRTWIKRNKKKDTPQYRQLLINQPLQHNLRGFPEPQRFSKSA
jgi:RNA polymerase sigma factor (sigma-70 family)